MILHTMSDDEKFVNVARITPIAMDVHKRHFEEICRKFAKGNRFPYFQRVVFEDDRKNMWWLTYMVRNKSDKKKGRIWTLCYTVYEIQKKKKDGNTGKGVLMFDPLAMDKKLNGENVMGLCAVYDIIPHAFNRYTQRYLKPKGKDDIEFQRKVESMMSRFGHIDMDGDISSDKHGSHPYDMFMSCGGMLRGQVETYDMFTSYEGMLRGQFETHILIRFYTYIGEDMMFNNQIERQDEIRKEYYQWEREGVFDVYIKNNKNKLSKYY